MHKLIHRHPVGTRSYFPPKVGNKIKPHIVMIPSAFNDKRIYRLTIITGIVRIFRFVERQHIRSLHHGEGLLHILLGSDGHVTYTLLAGLVGCGVHHKQILVGQATGKRTVVDGVLIHSCHQPVHIGSHLPGVVTLYPSVRIGASGTGSHKDGIVVER